MKKSNFKAKGFVTLMSVLIIGTVATSIAIFLILMGTDVYRTTANLGDSALAKTLADACAEKALNSLKDDINYAGNETVTFNKGSCIILPIINQESQTPTIESSATVSSTIRKVKVIASQITPQVEIQSWQEVADF